MAPEGRLPQEPRSNMAGTGERAVAAARTPAVAVGGLSLVGAGIAGYLSWRHAVGGPIACGGSGGCDIVNASRYAYFLGVPVAYLGLGLYGTLLGLALVQLLYPRAQAWLPVMVLALAAAGAGFSLYLTAMEVFVIRAICRWCVASQVVILLILAAAVALARRSAGAVVYNGRGADGDDRDDWDGLP